MKAALLTLVLLVGCTDDRRRDRLSAAECDEYARIMLDKNPGIESMADDLARQCRDGAVDRPELACFRRAATVTDLVGCTSERSRRRP